MVFTVRPEAFAVSRCRTQEEIPSPQRSQVEVELALRIDEQRAAPFLLQHLLAVGTFNVEILDEVIQVAAIGFGAKVRPTP